MKNRADILLISCFIIAMMGIVLLLPCVVIAAAIALHDGESGRAMAGALLALLLILVLQIGLHHEL